jgi:transposase
MQNKFKQLDFSNQKIFVGIDVHKKSWKVSVLHDQSFQKTFSQDPDPVILYNYLSRSYPGATYYSAYEAGFCGYWIHNELVSLGINSIIVNAADIPSTQKDKMHKEDKRDSAKIAKALRSGQLTPIYIPNNKTLNDRNLLRLRDSLTKDITRIKHKLKSFLLFHGINIPNEFESGSKSWTKAFVKWVDQIQMPEASGKFTIDIFLEEGKNKTKLKTETVKQIKILSESVCYKESIELLRSVPGIGLITAMEILTELEDINRFRNFDQLCSYIGFIPSTHSSGEKERTGNITRRGHSILRTSLIESAWIAIRRDPAMLMAHTENCKRMKSPKSIIKIARKLLSRIQSVLKNKKKYECGKVI